MTNGKPKKQRLDSLLVERGLMESRTQAQRVIMAGDVLVNEQRVDKPATPIAEDAVIRLKSPSQKYVGRGGLKLEHALNTFEISVVDRMCVDMGASTGGFTDCLLQHGALGVYAVDVGYNQLAWSLRQNACVQVFERTHARDFQLPDGGQPPSLGVIDVSFISLKKVVPYVKALLQPERNYPATVIALIKPQFEYLDYCQIKDFKGIVTDPNDVEIILNGVLNDVNAMLPVAHLGIAESPITGMDGNREFLAYWQWK